MTNNTNIIFDYNTKKFFRIHKKYKALCGKCAVSLLETSKINEQRANRKNKKKNQQQQKEEYNF